MYDLCDLAPNVSQLAARPRPPKIKKPRIGGSAVINGPDSFNGITKRVSVRVKLIKTKPKETQ